MQSRKRSILRSSALQTLLASLLCIVLGLLIGYIALLIINPAGAWENLVKVLKNFMDAKKAKNRLNNFGMTLIHTAPLLMCGLSVLFAYKVGLFNIGAAGQYVAGAGACIYCALALNMPWYVCILAAIIAGALLGALSGALKAYRNVNEVISCIMLNWISLYLVNWLLSSELTRPSTGKDTYPIDKFNPSAVLPNVGLQSIHKNASIGIPIAIIIAVLIWILLTKTKLGYELRATGLNKNAAKYCGMRDRYNLILTMAIAGGLAAMGAALFYLSNVEQWDINQTSLPAMGFNGIAVAFLGGLHPIGTIFSSFFIQHISRGGSNVDLNMYSPQISDLISSVIIYLCAFVLFIKQVMNNILDKRDSKRNRKGGTAA